MGAIAGPPTLASLRAQALVDVPIAPSGSSAFEFSQSIDVTGNLAGNTQFGFRLSGFGANGEDADDANAESGGFSGNVSSLVTAATFNFTANQNTLVVIGTTTQLIGGNGGNQTNQNISNNGGPGGDAGNIVATNSGDVILQGTFGGGATILDYQSRGGSGGSVASSGTNDPGQPEFNGGQGGPGGNSGSISVTNTADLTPINGSGSGSVFGISAISRGGGSGQGQTGRIGGSAGQLIVNQSGTLGITWASQIPTGSAPGQLYGILAQSIGGTGSSSYLKSTNGSDGGSGGGFFLDLGAGTNVTLTGSGNVGGAAAGGFSWGGRGGDSFEGEEGADSFGGTGGVAGTGSFSYETGGASATQVGSLILATDAAVTAVGDGINGLSAIHVGGDGGNGVAYQQHSNGGVGGATADILVSLDTATATTAISANGNGAAGIFVQNQAGTGGSGQFFTEVLGGEAGNGAAGGTAGDITINVSGNTSISSLGSTQAPGIVAFSGGGNGGAGGELSSGDSGGGAGLAGNGASAGSIQVNLNDQSTVSTVGSNSPAIFAQSVGGAGGAGGLLSSDIGGNAPNGGTGGNSGGVSVVLFGGTRATTSGDSSSVLVGQSVSGVGGAGGARQTGFVGGAGQGGNGGSTGVVNVSNNGTIQSSGANSHGLLAQQFSGVGGVGGDASVVIYGSAGNGGASGVLGVAQVSNSGRITTLGSNSHGFLVQSVAGGGGAGGNSELGIVSLGGTNPVVSNAGLVTASNNAAIATSGNGSHAALLQSLGGGGGDGGSSAGLIGIGGTGGGGGAGGTVTANFLPGSTVTTQGDLAIGLLGQSIGGGGGNGGNASFSTAGVTLQIGGTGGSGGNGGKVDFTSAGDITTMGSKAVGILGQSIGGGGGNGGAAYGLAVSLEFSAAVAFGGSGGAGGNGGNVTVAVDGGTIATGQYTPSDQTTNLLPVDAFGIVAQSVGRGGGNGGSATAGAVTVGIPMPPDGINVTAATSIAMGGSGGGGGAGGSVTVSLDPGTSLITQGQGSHALLAQSIGGGGGNGGDSSASSATLDYKLATKRLRSSTFGIQMDVSVGGSGGVASEGGAVDVMLGAASGGSTTSIVTYGDFADGINAQSIGGGGGNAGIGSGNTQSFGTKTSQTTVIALGSTGGAGGNGGNVSVTTQPNGSIFTYGDGSHGILAQSVGGGGGTSQGGTVSMGLGIRPLAPGGEVELRLSAAVEFQVGATGGAGGNAGFTAEVTHSGVIQTHGNDAVGILLQSIGGGGGVVGSSGAEASADNPLVPPLPGTAKVARAFQAIYVNIVSKDGVPTTIPFPKVKFDLSLGSTSDGSSGSAGAATLNLAGTIVTQGDWSQGVVVQAIGGGGGKAGSAAYTGSNAVPDLNLTVGSASASGNDHGGVVTLTPTAGSITTAGYSAFGVLLQSIGGGGGLAADGSDAANGGDPSTSGNIFIGNSVMDAGNGNTVIVNAGTLTVTTTGEAAHGVVLQSIGSGGGVGGAGNRFGDPADSNLRTRVGSTGSNSGTGGPIEILGTNVVVRTNGDYAYGVLAQSIGGSGGLASVRGPSASQVGGSLSDNVESGFLKLAFGEGSLIETQGDGAHGIVAQSISGGGGIGGYAPGGDTISVTKVPNNLDGFDTSGAITLALDDGALILTNGNGAHGIVAQSIGGGGGIVPVPGGATYFGSTNSAGTFSAGSNISITLEGSVNTAGDNSVGVFAQSTSASEVGGTIGIVVNGALTTDGFTTNPAAIWMDGGNAGNFITIGELGFVQSASAIVYTGAFAPTVNNQGFLSGSISAAASVGGVGQLNNLASGTWFSGGTSDVDVFNEGIIEIGRQRAEAQFDATVIRGDLTQSDSGSIVVDVDFLNSRADLLTITGDADLAGKVVPVTAGAFTSQEVRFARVEGDVTGSLRVDGDRFGDDSLFFDYGITRRDRDLYVGVDSDFGNPALGELSPNQRSLADYLDSTFRRNRDREFAELFGALDRATRGDADAARHFIDEFSPGATLGFGARGLATALSFQDAALNGPIFEGDTAQPTETSGSYFRTYGRTASQSVPGGYSDFTQNNTTYQVGGQWEVAPDWYLGGAVAYQYDWLGGDNGTASGDGHTGLAAATLKHERDAWLFSGAIGGSAGWFETERSVSLPGYRADLEGHPNVQTVGGALRVAYTASFEDFYVRPMLTLSTTYVRSGGYTESGGGPLDLAVQSNDELTFVGSPGFEMGLRTDFRNGIVLRSFVLGSVNISTTDGWTQNARFAEASASAGEFGTTIPIDRYSGRVTAGWQLQTSERTSFSVQYEGEYSGHVTSHGGAVGMKFQF